MNLARCKTDDLTNEASVCVFFCTQKRVKLGVILVLEWSNTLTFRQNITSGEVRDC